MNSHWKECKIADAPFEIIDGDRGSNTLKVISIYLLLDGSAQPQLPIRDLKEIFFLLPPLPEQRAIAGVLSSLDDKIDLLYRQNKTLEGMAEALWREMFVEEADPGWKKGKLGDIANI
ncbi:MAG: hypothetical protein COW04_08020, partial [Deltaproteobacteria bacterium CG12_big_fil_rev_8_21_14_0_65_43_10]